MPSILKNKPPVKVVLDCDKDIENPPTFLVKRLTFGESKNLGILMDDLGGGDAKTMFSTVEQCVKDIIVGWERMGQYVFEEHDLSDILSFSEFMELLAKCLEAGQLSDSEKN